VAVASDDHMQIILLHSDKQPCQQLITFFTGHMIFLTLKHAKRTERKCTMHPTTTRPKLQIHQI